MFIQASGESILLHADDSTWEGRHILPDLPRHFQGHSERRTVLVYKDMEEFLRGSRQGDRGNIKAPATVHLGFLEPEVMRIVELTLTLAASLVSMEHLQSIVNCDNVNANFTGEKWA